MSNSHYSSLLVGLWYTTVWYFSLGWSVQLSLVSSLLASLLLLPVTFVTVFPSSLSVQLSLHFSLLASLYIDRWSVQLSLLYSSGWSVQLTTVSMGWAEWGREGREGRGCLKKQWLLTNLPLINPRTLVSVPPSPIPAPWEWDLLFFVWPLSCNIVFTNSTHLIIHS